MRRCLRGSRLRLAACAAVLLLSPAMADAPSLRVARSGPPRPLEPAGRPFATRAPAPPQPLAFLAAPRASVGASFQTSQFDSDSGSIVPDTMAAVGPDHVVELINGNFEIFEKTGRSLLSRSLFKFWTDLAGTPYPISYFGDPRIVYDPVSERFFASSLDFEAPNRIYLARSESADPTEGWRGLRFEADTEGPAQLHDFETLGVDADVVVLCTVDFQVAGEFPGTKSCYSIPKADLLLETPSLANLTRFEELLPAATVPPELWGIWASFQPVSDLSGERVGRMPLLAPLGLVTGQLLRGDIFGGAETGATFGELSFLDGDPGYGLWLGARQPAPSVGRMKELALTGAALSGAAIQVDGSLWAAHNVQGSAQNTAIRWYEIDEAANAVVQSGLIEAPALDLVFPSIAANEFGQVVIGYTCTGPELPASACASAGETVAGVTEFDPPLLLRQGAGYYDRRGPDGRNRWGDYSATVADSEAPCVFWTFQEFVAEAADTLVGSPTRLSGGAWGTEASQLIFASCPVPTTTTTSTSSTTTTTSTSTTSTTTSTTTTTVPTTSTSTTTTTTTSTTTTHVEGRVAICHRGKKTKLVKLAKVDRHLRHGDSTGPCPFDSAL